MRCLFGCYDATLHPNHFSILEVVGIAMIDRNENDVSYFMFVLFLAVVAHTNQKLCCLQRVVDEFAMFLVEQDSFGRVHAVEWEFFRDLHA